MFEERYIRYMIKWSGGLILVRLVINTILMNNICFLSKRLRERHQYTFCLCNDCCLAQYHGLIVTMIWASA